MPRVVSRFHIFSPLLAFALSLSAQQHVQQPPVAALDVQVRTKVSKVSPSLYGLMTEEINSSYDGLYAEMVRNRTFQDSHWDLPAWSLVQNGNSIASVELDKSTGPSTALLS
jgi:alpha-N-arabinofuranosidase